MAQGILLDQSRVLEVKLENDYYTVNYGFHQFASFHKDDALSKRITVTQLIQMEVRKRELTRVFHVHHESMTSWEKIYKEGGMQALVALRAGAKTKVTDSMKDYIYILYKNLKGKRGYRATIISEIKKLYEITISKETIRRAVNEKEEKEASNADSGIEEKNTEAKAEDEGKEVIVKHGGALITLPFLSKYKAQELFMAGTREARNGYTFKECAIALFFLLVSRLLRVEENIKHYDDEMMGGLIGRERLPSLKTIRRVMGRSIEEIGDKVEEMKKQFALRCLSLYEHEGIFYIDGHFMQYGGGEKILFGYNPHKRLAEKGRTAYVVNMPSGRPIYEILSDGYENFIDKIEKIVDFLIGEAGIERPTMVFDRGAFGWENLERIEKNAGFLCWYKGKPYLSKKLKWEEVRMPCASNKYGEVEYQILECAEKVIDEGEEDGRGYRRMIFIKKGEKISPAISNNKDKSAKELTLIITRRWGAQENIFKELVIDGFDKIHTYKKDDYDEEYLDREGLDESRTVENPEYRKMESERRKLQNKRDLTLGRIARRENESGKVIKPTKKQTERLGEINDRLTVIEGRLLYLPKEILRLEYIEKNSIKRLSNEKKKYFDLLNLLAFNIRKDIVEIIGPVYKNNRDVHQMVIKILRMMTKIHYSRNETEIVFAQKMRGSGKDALNELCEFATSIAHETELFPEKLSFSAS